jgi:amino acid adenylation domain-containing protein
MKNVEDIYELSPLQHGMLFHTLYAPVSGAYIEQFVWTLDASLNVAAFKRAWQRVLERHAVLRTGFHWKELDKPLQVVHRQVKLDWDEQDWRRVSAAEQPERLNKYLAADRKRGFDLSKVPLLRLALFRTPNAYQFLLSHHHILMDGWCGPLILGEVMAFYEAFCSNQDLQLPPPRPYREYIAWLQKQDVAKAEAFWRQTLRGFTTPTTLGIDQAPGDFLRREGVYTDQQIQLPAGLTEALQAFGRQHGLTFNTLVQGAWGLLVSHYSQQEDIVFGTVVSGRPADLPDVEKMTGLFVNSLPMRLKAPGDARLLPWLKDIQAQQVEMRQYEYAPLVNIQGWSAVPRGVPLFENILVFENYPTIPGASSRPNSQISLDDFRAFEQTNYPLTLLVIPGTILKAIYDQQRYSDAAIARLLQHLQTLLSGLIRDPQQRLKDLLLLTEGERRQIIREWNATQADYPRTACLHELFEAQVARTPDAPAVVFNGRQLTYRELDQRAAQLAQVLQAQGVGPDKLVGICVERSLEMMVGLLGILKAGGAYVPMDPLYPKDRLAFMLEDAQVQVLLTQQSQLEHLPAYAGKIICLDAELPEAAPVNAKRPAAENLAYVIYTSGSTGRPKGVQISHSAVQNLLESMRKQLGYSAQDIFLAVTTLSFDIAGLELFLPLISGSRVVILSREDAADPLRLPARLQESRATVMQATPVTWRLLLDSTWPGDKNLTALCGGEAFPGDLAEKLVKRVKKLWNLYGPTETTIWSSIYPVIGGGAKIIPIGKPLANTSLHVLDRNLNPVAVGVIGDLYIGGEGLARGYWQRPELTAEKFIPNPFSTEPGARLYATGDTARYLPDGNLEFLGRVDLQVKLRGLRIELGEIETILSQHPGVREAVVAIRKDEVKGERLVAYVVPNNQYSDPNSRQGWESEQTSAWRSIWDEAYGQAAPVADPTFNISGWNSRYTGQPIPAAEMKQWVDNAVERILANKPRRVLEIGCGTGLLLFRVAPHCETYLAADFSAKALQALQPIVSQQGLSQVTLSQRMADDFSCIEPGKFDTVVLNSVVQYFPSVDYLLRVLENAAQVVADGGRIIVGDVRSLPLLEAFHTSIEMQRATPTLAAAELLPRAQASLAKEQELVIDPAFFFALKGHLPQIQSVEILPKRGAAHNELTRFRYEAILHIGKASAVPEAISWQPWDGTTLADLRSTLAGQSPSVLGITDIPNQRVQAQIQAQEWLKSGSQVGTVGELAQKLQALEISGPEVDDFYQLGAELGYAVDFNWPGTGKTYQVVFRRSGADAAAVSGSCFAQEIPTAQPWAAYVSAPGKQMPVRELLTQLHSSLEEKLPPHAIPSTFLVLEKLPLTPNGKVDRRALPNPGENRPEAAGNYVAPRTETEGKLAGIWKRLLGIEQVGSNDNFFGLGGHSLAAIQLVNRVRDTFNVEIPLRTSYEMPTVAELAERIDKARKSEQGPSKTSE